MLRSPGGPPAARRGYCSAVTIDVLAQGPGWLVVHKPSGLAVHRSARVGDVEETVLDRLAALGVDADPVHRLDRPTSGCLLLSSDPAQTSALQAAQIAGRKRYVALVRGQMAVGAPIAVDQPLTDSKGVLRDARTTVIPLAACPEPRCSLVLAIPHTGRIHQIRRHLRDLSHPILGDSTRGDTRVNRVWREEHGLARLALHCLSLGFGEVEVVCPLPPDLLGLLRGLPLWEAAVAALPELEAP